MYIKINVINMYVIILMSRMDLHAVITCYKEKEGTFSGPGEEDPTDLPWVYKEVLTGVDSQICSKGSEFSLRIGRIILH